MTAYTCFRCKQVADDGLTPAETKAALEAFDDDDYVDLCEPCAEAYHLFVTQGTKLQ